MDSLEIVISTKILNIVFLLSVYVPACLISRRWLLPHLGSAARRLAGVFILAQLAAIALSLLHWHVFGFHGWLWDLNGEWNVPAALAATQLMSVGCVAFCSAGLGRKPSVPLRLYLIAIAALCCFLALDELFQFHETSGVLEDTYTALGYALVFLALPTALRLSRQNRIWLFCLLIGLGTAAVGAVAIEQYRDYCGNLGPFQLNECFEPYHYEEPLEFIGVWLALLAVLGILSEDTLSLRVWRALYLIPVACVLLLLVLVPNSPFAIQSLAQPPRPAVAFESDASLYDYRIKANGTGFNIRLSLSPANWDFVEGLGFSVHLVGQVSGDSIAHVNSYVQRDLKFTLGPRAAHLFRQDRNVIIPPDAPKNRALWVVLTLWRGQYGTFADQKALSSDLPLLSDTQVILDEVVLPLESPPPSVFPLAAFDNGFSLEAVEAPERAQAGETLPLRFTWRSDEDSQDDYAQFLHFVREASGAWWGYDQQPLGPRLPTRLWYQGLADSETWLVPLPDDLAPGRYVVYTGLYLPRDLERIPATDADGLPWPDNRMLLGRLIIE